ncbi:MAG TPA: pyruvate kinase [Pseudonocardiaceae bacterium]|nr:pyruvate kinase [Pseudonocardiaceae bacterium]
MSRRVKIVCTIGPATASLDRIRELVRAGMDVARLHLSHGSHADHARVYSMIRQASDESGRAVGILADLQGPKVRLGRFAAGPVQWCAGDEVRLTVAEVVGTHDRVSTTYAGLVADAGEGDRLLVNDGKVALVVRKVEDADVVCEVVEGGLVSDHQGLSLPRMNASVPALSAKDITDLEFALRLRVDLVALPFVRSPADIDQVHRMMDALPGGRLPVIAKLEKSQAVDNLEAIVVAFDGVMVSRGALGVELPLEQVPLVQKRAIQMARENAKPVVVATQMLDSMIANTRPTRAEASDVASAVLDGADAVMLSQETSVGRYPIESVNTASRIIRAAEASVATVPPLNHVPHTQRGVLACAAREIGEQLEAKALVAFTHSGDTARRLARLHSHLPLLAFTPVPVVRNQLALSWGTETFLVAPVRTTDVMVWQIDEAVLSIKRYQPGDLVVVVAGSPPATEGSTNLIRVHRLGEDDLG